MKKFFVLALVVVMAVSLAACSGGNADEPEQPQDPSSETQSVEGVVIDATMNVVAIADVDGNEWSFATEGANTDGLPDGILLGMALNITYEETGEEILVATSITEVPREITGTVKDATMNTVIITNEAGDLSFNLGDEVEKDLADGLLIGNEVTITCTGGVDVTDTSHATVTKITDTK